MKCKVALCITIVMTGLIFSSYCASKQSANKLVGGWLGYYVLTRAKIGMEPFRRDIGWVFMYSHGAFEEQFYIYTTFTGRVISTNPIDFENRKRKLERKGIYPLPE